MAKTTNSQVARFIIEQVIQEMIADNEAALNGEMADEASKRLGRKIEQKEISRIRNQIGLDSFQLLIHNVASQVRKQIQNYYHSDR
jgi:uncharacterized protein YggL (DUF469 family)